MEPPEWLEPFASAEVVRYALDHFSIGDNEKALADIEKARARQADPEFRSGAAAEVMLRKNYLAPGAWDPADRSRALDDLGFSSQLIFPSMPNTLIEEMEHQAEPDLTYATATAANRAQIAFCSGDPRLLPVCSVPMQSIEHAGPHARQTIDGGAAALLIPNRMPKLHAHSHVGFDPVWTAAQEAGIPVVMHVGIPELVMPPQHRNNGLPPEPDFHGGGENFRSVSYMAISAAPLQALSMLIFDGVLERFPDLRIGVIELGAVWLPGLLAPARGRVRRLRTARATIGQAQPAPVGLRAAPSAGHALPHRTHWLDHRELSTRDLHVQLRLPPRGGRPQSTAPFRPRSGAPARRCPGALLPAELRGSHGHGCLRAGGCGLDD